MSDEKVEQLLSTLERLEKAGELKKFLKKAPEISREELWKSTVIPPVLEGFKKMHDFCMVELSLHLSEMEKEMSWVNYYAEYCKNIYDGYAVNKENIKNPDILNFMKDYEEYYMTKEKEKEKKMKKPSEELVVRVLGAIEDALEFYIYNNPEEDYVSPFENTGDSFKNDVFEVNAYYWGEDEKERKKPNFKYKNIEISWYKYLGRGMHIPEITYEELDEMLNDCIKSLI